MSLGFMIVASGKTLLTASSPSACTGGNETLSLIRMEEHTTVSVVGGGGEGWSHRWDGWSHHWDVIDKL